MVICPEWLEIRQVSGAMTVPPALHAGEREAIQLATTMRADLILVDDAAARRHAIACGLRVVRTLALLEGAYQKGILSNLEDALIALRASNFFMTDSLFNEIRERNRIKS